MGADLRLRSGVWSFPHAERLGDSAGKRGCQALEVPVWAGDPGPAPGSASSSSCVREEERNRSHVTLLTVISSFLSRRQRV